MGMENPMERQFIEQAERSREGLHPTLRGAHLEAKKAIEAAEVDPNDFMYARGYSKEQIERDLELVERREKDFESNETDQKKTAEVFEAIVLDQGELSNWFGQNAETIKTSRYDDIFNGVDLLIEFEDASAKELSHLGLAVDVTFSQKKLEEKLGRIRGDIEKGKLSEIRYFYSEKEGVRERRAVPRVVVGVEREQVVELAALWLQQKNMNLKEARGKANKALAAHPAQRVMLEEIALQLEKFKEYAATLGRKALVATYEKDLEIVRELLAQKDKEGVTLEGTKSDRVFEGIERTLSQIF